MRWPGMKVSGQCHGGVVDRARGESAPVHGHAAAGHAAAGHGVAGQDVAEREVSRRAVAVGAVGAVGAEGCAPWAAAPVPVPPWVLDLLYFGGLLVSIPYLVALGKGARVADHWRRRTRAVPLRRSARPCIWVHGVSVGEILSARRFLDLLHADYPDCEIVLSSTTRAGLEAGRRHYGGSPAINGSPIFSYPFDLSVFVKRAFDRIRPDLVVIVEHELWPNFLGHARARGVPVAIVNGRLSERSLRGYRLLSRVMPWPPPGIELFCVEDGLSAERFRSLGVPSERVRVTGNFKFDNVPPAATDARARLALSPSDWALVAASVHPGEHPAVIAAFDAVRRRRPRSRLVLAPRRMESLAAIEAALRRRGLESLRYSRLRGLRDDGAAAGARADTAGDAARPVVLIDTFGDLPALMAAGDAVFVGGSLVPFGGHNIIEPASHGRPVLIGPHYQNFHHVVTAFERHDAITIVRDADDLAARLLDLHDDPRAARSLGARGRVAVDAEQGSSARTLDALRPILDGIADRARSAARE